MDTGDGPPVEPQTVHSIDLVRRAQAGEKEAMNHLCARYYERVRPIVRARIGPELRRQVDTVDILQETFLEAVRIFDRFEVRDEASLIRWLSKIAEHRVRAAVQHWRAQKRDPRREARLGPGSSGSGGFGRIPAAARSPSMDLAHQEDEERLLACLDELKEEHREVIVLRDFIRASWEDIAEQMDRPSPAAARMLHTRARVELSAVFGRED